MSLYLIYLFYLRWDRDKERKKVWRVEVRQVCEYFASERYKRAVSLWAVGSMIPTRNNSACTLMMTDTLSTWMMHENLRVSLLLLTFPWTSLRNQCTFSFPFVWTSVIRVFLQDSSSRYQQDEGLRQWLDESQWANAPTTLLYTNNYFLIEKIVLITHVIKLLYIYKTVTYLQSIARDRGTVQVSQRFSLPLLNSQERTLSLCGHT